MKNQKGFTVVEILVASLILFTTLYAVIEVSIHSKSLSLKAVDHVVEEKQVSQVIENIRSSLEHYQASYDPTQTGREELLDVKNLPSAWSRDIVAELGECPDCPGRLGYTIQPFDGMRGLYLVTVRLTHQDWGDKFKDYEFVMGAR